MNRAGFFKTIVGGAAAAAGFKHVPVKAVPVAINSGKTAMLCNLSHLGYIGSVVRSDFCPGQGWQLCDGAMLCGEHYQELFNVLGLQYGESKDKTWFNIPDWRVWNLHGDGTTSETFNHWIKVE